MRRTSDAYAPGVSVCSGIAPGAERARVDGRGVVGERDALAAGTETPVGDDPRCLRVLRNRARCGEGLHGVGVWSVEWRWRGEAAGTGTPVRDDPWCHCRATEIAPCAERASWCGVWCVGMWKCGNVEVWECGVVVEWCGAKQSPSGGLPCPACRSARLPICEPHVHVDGVREAAKSPPSPVGRRAPVSSIRICTGAAALAGRRRRPVARMGE